MTAADDRFVSLPEAAREAGCSISAIRKWYRRDLIGSHLVDGRNGPERRVHLGEVKARVARGKDRHQEPVPAAPVQGVVGLDDFLRTVAEEFISVAAENGRLRARVEVLEAENARLRTAFL